MTKEDIKSKKLKKIMVFGTFDGLHKGHLNLFKQARSLAKDPYLIVSVARDKNVLKIKGKPPHSTELQRKKFIEECKLVDKVVLGGLRDHLPHIIREGPDMIALGYDQKTYVRGLKVDLEKALNAKNENSKRRKIMIRRMKPFKEHIYKNNLLHKGR